MPAPDLPPGSPQRLDKRSLALIGAGVLAVVVLVVVFWGAGKTSGKAAKAIQPQKTAADPAQQSAKTLTRPSPTAEPVRNKGTAATLKAEAQQILVQPVRIPPRVPIRLRLEQDVPGGTREGTVVRLSSAGGLRYGNAVAIADGAPVNARVSGSGRRGFFRRDYVAVALVSVRATDGQAVPLRASPNINEQGGGLDLGKPERSARDRPKGVLAAKGSEYVAYVAEEVVVRAPRRR